MINVVLNKALGRISSTVLVPSYFSHFFPFTIQSSFIPAYLLALIRRKVIEEVHLDVYASFLFIPV